jgi:hypothetical protein
MLKGNIIRWQIFCALEVFQSLCLRRMIESFDFGKEIDCRE